MDLRQIKLKSVHHLSQLLLHSRRLGHLSHFGLLHLHLELQKDLQQAYQSLDVRNRHLQHNDVLI